MEDQNNKEPERQDFSRLYGLEVELMGICFNRVEETERSLFKLKRILDQEKTQKENQGREEQKLSADLAEAEARRVATEEEEARKRLEQGIAQPQASEE
eukprot:5987823-Heterocapsa_arctica.AAC.1